MNHPLPRGWQEKKLIDLSPLQRGFDLPNSKIINGEYPIVYSNGIKAYHNEYKCKGVGVVTGRSGTIGKVTYVEKDYWPHNTSLWVTDFKGNLPKFVFYLLSYIDLSKYDAGTSVPTLNRNDVHKITVLVPPLDEQKRIADILSTFDDLIENLTKLIEKKEIYKKGVMQRVLTGEVRFEGFTDEWETVKLGDIAIFETGTSKSKYIDDNGKYIIIDMGAVSEKGKIIANKKTNFNQEFIKKNSLIMPKDDIGNGRIIGKTAVIDIDNLYVLGDHVFQLTIKNNNPYFISYCINSHDNNKQIRRLCAGSMQIGLSKKSIENVRIKIPPSIEEQNKIAELLTLIDKDIEILKQLLHLRKLQKKGLMQKLLTGEVRL